MVCSCDSALRFSKCSPRATWSDPTTPSIRSYWRAGDNDTPSQSWRHGRGRAGRRHKCRSFSEPGRGLALIPAQPSEWHSRDSRFAAPSPAGAMSGLRRGWTVAGASADADLDEHERVDRTVLNPQEGGLPSMRAPNTPPKLPRLWRNTGSYSTNPNAMLHCIVLQSAAQNDQRKGAP